MHVIMSGHVDVTQVSRHIGYAAIGTVVTSIAVLCCLSLSTTTKCRGGDADNLPGKATQTKTQAPLRRPLPRAINPASTSTSHGWARVIRSGRWSSFSGHSAPRGTLVQ